MTWEGGAVMGHKGGKWTRVSFTGGEAERAGALQPEEMTRGILPVCTCWEGVRTREPDSSGQEAMGTNKMTWNSI